MSGQAVAYIRVSTTDQSISVEAQRQRIQDWCQANHMALVAVYADVGISGGAALDKRPGLMDALAALQPGMTLVAAKRDRIARDTMYSCMIERLAQRKQASIRTCDGVGDGDSPEAQLLRRMVDAFAEYERMIIKARTKTALQHLKHQGQRISGRLPYGYRLAADGSTLVADDAEQLIITAARGYAEAGLSLRQIAQRLAADGHYSRTGQPFTPKAINTMLRSAA